MAKTKVDKKYAQHRLMELACIAEYRELDNLEREEEKELSEAVGDYKKE